jgi:hypothetical protein
MVAQALTEGVLTMTTTTEPTMSAPGDLIQLTDDEIENVGGGLFLSLAFLGFMATINNMMLVKPVYVVNKR